MTSRVFYAVSPEKRNLVRFTDKGAELYCPTNDGKDNWVSMPHLNEIRYGLGDSVWYDSVDENEAREWMEKFKRG